MNRDDSRASEIKNIVRCFTKVPVGCCPPVGILEASGWLQTAPASDTREDDMRSARHERGAASSKSTQRALLDPPVPPGHVRAASS